MEKLSEGQKKRLRALRDAHPVLIWVALVGLFFRVGWRMLVRAGRR